MSRAEKMTLDFSSPEEFQRFLDMVSKGEWVGNPGDHLLFPGKDGEPMEMTLGAYNAPKPIYHMLFPQDYYEKALRDGGLSSSEMRQTIYDQYLRKEKNNA